MRQQVCSGFDLIENLRDAYEAAEECFFLIEMLTEGNPRRLDPLLEAYYRAAGGEPIDAATAQAYARLRYGRSNPFPEIVPGNELTNGG